MSKEKRLVWCAKRFGAIAPTERQSEVLKGSQESLEVCSGEIAEIPSPQSKAATPEASRHSITPHGILRLAGPDTIALDQVGFELNRLVGGQAGSGFHGGFQVIHNTGGEVGERCSNRGQ